MEERAKLTDIAPKDVKQLEVLRPVNAPSMGERFKQAIEKEKRLEVASRPIQKKRKQEERNEEEDDEEGVKHQSKAAKKRKRKAKNAESKRGKLDESALNQQDTLKEGIDWSDDEE